MLFATLALAAGLIKDDLLTQHVTYTQPAATVERALAGLSQRAPTKLTVAGPIAKDIVVLRFVDVPLKDAMAKIAEATTAEWRLEKGGYRLERTDAVVQSFHNEARLRSEPFLRADLDKKAKEFQRTEGATEAQIATALSRETNTAKTALTSADKDVLNQTPGERLLIRIAESIGVERLAAIAETGKKTVYALPATRRQEPLTGIASAIDRYVNEHNRWTPRRGFDRPRNPGIHAQAGPLPPRLAEDYRRCALEGIRRHEVRPRARQRPEPRHEGIR